MASHSERRAIAATAAVTAAGSAVAREDARNVLALAGLETNDKGHRGIHDVQADDIRRRRRVQKTLGP